MFKIMDDKTIKKSFSINTEEFFNNNLTHSLDLFIDNFLQD